MQRKKSNNIEQLLDATDESLIRQKKVRRKLPISTYLVYLLVITLAFTGISFSRYGTTEASNSTTRIAMLASGSNVTDLPAEGYPGMEPAIVKIELTNHKIVEDEEIVSEVALKCYVTAENITKNLPLELAFYSDSACTTEVVNPVVTFNASEANGMTYYLKIAWPAEKNEERYAFEIDAIRVIATAEQID